MKTTSMSKEKTLDVNKERTVWTLEEDELLKDSVAELGTQDWKLVAERFVDKSFRQCWQRWNRVIRPDLLKGPWSPQEDALLTSLVVMKMHVPEIPSDSNDGQRIKIDWSVIAENINGRSEKQCRERWSTCLDPTIKKGEWSVEEDKLIMEMQAKEGNCWSKIAKMLPGRVENAIRTRFHSLKRAEKRAWTKREDNRLLQLIAEKRSWGDIVSSFKGKRSKHQLMKRYRILKGSDEESEAQASLKRLREFDSSGTKHKYARLPMEEIPLENELFYDDMFHIDSILY